MDPTCIPWIFITETIDKQYCTGILCGFIEYVSKSLNFSYEFVKELDGIGQELSNGSWIGFMGRILKDVRMTFKTQSSVEFELKFFFHI